MTADANPPRWQTLLAFAIIYFVWGSTFLAIRIGVREVPPFTLAALRFLIAGFLILTWISLRGGKKPRSREWLSAFVLAFLIFVLDYGLLFWAERRVPSGIAAVVMATIPVFTALSEIIILRTQKLTLPLAAALAAGICGVAVLVTRSLLLPGMPVDTAGALALLVAALSWSLASALSRKLPSATSKVVSSGMQMLAGGVLLALAAAALGEFGHFDPSNVSLKAWLALAYLIVAGSIVAFTAYIWLIHHHSLTKVGTYAYVNPLVAVVLGYFAGDEALGFRTIVGTALVLVSVVLITTMRSPKLRVKQVS